MSIPSNYPQYITSIVDPNDKARWQNKYVQQYEQEYNNLNPDWNVVKAVMLSVSLFALTLFPSIILVARANSYSVAASISLFCIGTAASVCTGIYYGSLSEKNRALMYNMSATFPQKFQVYFNQQRLQIN